jgi:hypothetical protein
MLISKSICLEVLKYIINCKNILLFSDDLDKVVSKNNINSCLTIDSQKLIMEISVLVPSSSLTPKVAKTRSTRNGSVSKSKKQIKSYLILKGMFFLNLKYFYDNTRLYLK